MELIEAAIPHDLQSISPNKPRFILQKAIKINSYHTECIACPYYGDKTLIMVTQINKPGTITLGKCDRKLSIEEQWTHKEEHHNDSLGLAESDRMTFSIQILFGKRVRQGVYEEEDLHSIQIEDVLMRQIFELFFASKTPISANYLQKSILLCTGWDKSFEQEIQNGTLLGKEYLKIVLELIAKTLKIIE